MRRITDSMREKTDQLVSGPKEDKPKPRDWAALAREVVEYAGNDGLHRLREASADFRQWEEYHGQIPDKPAPSMKINPAQGGSAMTPEPTPEPQTMQEKAAQLLQLRRAMGSTANPITRIR